MMPVYLGRMTPMISQVRFLGRKMAVYRMLSTSVATTQRSTAGLDCFQFSQGVHHDSFLQTRLAHITVFFTNITNRPAMTPTMALSTHGGTPFSGVLGGTGVVRVGI